MSSSITPQSCNRQMWIGNGPPKLLRKQKSCIDVLSSSSSTNLTSTINNNHKARDRRTVLQKQLSVDHRHQHQLNQPQSRHYQQQHHRSHNYSNYSTWINTNASGSSSNSGNNNNNNNNSNSPEASLRILAAVKKRPQATTRNECIPHPLGQELTDRFKKVLKGRDDRINLKIFLGHSSAIPEPDCLSDTESLTDAKPFANKENLKQEENNSVNGVSSVHCVATTTTNQTNDGNNKNNGTTIVTTAARRTQFQSSRGVVSVDRRPPLVRAMSAPIRNLEEPTKVIHNKKKTRRRRNFRDRDELLIINDDADDGEESDIVFEKPPSAGRGSRPQRTSSATSKSVPRARSALGCDIVTLVSLLSSGGSDSERDESPTASQGATPKTDIAALLPMRIRAPMLRKTGKSGNLDFEKMSFQENDLQKFSSPSKDFTSMFRRGSVAPLAARIRANRPPTAPPGSVFLTKYGSEEFMSSVNYKNNNNNNDKKSLSNVTAEDRQLASDCDGVENCGEQQTPKEQECWKLFQKMSNKGISVSYDTILRGMLTPTELRMIQKQKDLELARQASIDAENLDDIVVDNSAGSDNKINPINTFMEKSACNETTKASSTN